jgi:CMP-N-acetylneuraminate monooxygenase
LNQTAESKAMTTGNKTEDNYWRPREKSASDAAPKSKAIDLGLETSFTELPARISLESKSFYLVRGEAGYHLLSTVCPHQGGEVVNAAAHFECPQHGWCFEHTTGKGINNTRELSALPVTVRRGHLFAEVSLPSAASSTMAQRSKSLDQLTVQLHAHACLEIAYKGFSLLTDPWLCGPAFLGSWALYPPPVVDVSSLRPNAIVITHEHSDHFHEPTLTRFDRSTAVYVPDFPNRRLVEWLVALGFQDVYPMAFGRIYEVSENFRLTCFGPEGLWNDAIVLVDIDGFRLLNINDAGLNRSIASQVVPVDAVASQFSTGASGYPLTWTHLGDAEKIRILERSCHGKLRMLKEAMELYQGNYLLPFASHFALWHRSHREYARLLRTNTLEDVVQTFEGTHVRVVDLLPGEIWDVSSGNITRLPDIREHIYDPDHKLQYLERSFDINEFEQYHPVSGHLTYPDMEAYLSRLNETPEIVFCEDLTVRLRATGGNDDPANLDISFSINGGRLRMSQTAFEMPNLLIEIPSGILKQIVTKNLSWDEAHIGYWCRFTRSPDIYHAGFWRLLQAPYFNKPPDPPLMGYEPITGDSVVADIVERHGERAERILRRYGFYCTGCHRSPGESLAQGAKYHGITKGQTDRLVTELNAVFWPTDRCH